MKKLLAVLVALLMSSAHASAQQVQKFAWSTYAYDWTAVAYTYCSMLGQNGDPFAAAFNGTSRVKTVGSNTTVTEFTAGALPFANLAVGDMLMVRRIAGATVVTDRVSITAKASGASITVSSAVDWSATGGLEFSWLDLTCGTAAADGWFYVRGFDGVDATVEWNTKNATSLDMQLECKVADGSAYTVSTRNLTATGVYQIPLLTGVYDRCRLGMKLNTDTGAQSINSYVAVKTGGGPEGGIVTAYGGYWERGVNSELLTLAAAATTDTTASLLPANAIIEAVVIRVTTIIPTAATFQVGDATTAGRFATGVAVAAGTTAVGLLQRNPADADVAGPVQTAAAKIRVTPNLSPATPTGVVRLEVFYSRFVPPTQ